MDTTVLLTGMLPGVLIVATILTAVVSWFILRLYRRKVLHLMSKLEGWHEETPAIALRTGTETVRHPYLQIREIASDDHILSTASQTALHRTATAVRSTIFVHLVAGLTFALVFTAAWMITSGGGFLIGRFVFLAACHLFPVVLVVNLAVAITNRERMYVLGLYAIFFAVVSGFTLARSPDLLLWQPFYYWLYANAPSMLLLLFFLHPRVRAIGPLVLCFMIAGVLGSQLMIALLLENENLLRFMVNIGIFITIPGKAMFYIVQVLGFLPFALLAWLALLWIGKQYQAKQLSDQSIVIDAIWLSFAIVNSIQLSFEGGDWFFTGLLAFVAYKLVAVIGFRRIAKATSASFKPPMLLLLRVFALGPRSERFFEAFSKRWRYGGGIILISGPDLMTKTIEPHEMLHFVGGRLARQFVRNKDDLERQIMAIDRIPDPDGRYRVNEFFCHADTWQATMRRLAVESTVILMDLRGFSLSNQGCLYELGQLLGAIPLERVVFLVDNSIDRGFLESSLQQLWAHVDRNSPNLNMATPTVRFMNVINHDKQTIERLQGMLLDTQPAAASA